MEDIKTLMTEAELSQYEKLETASDALSNICNYKKRTLGYAASELQGVILKEMRSIRDNILTGRRLCYDYGSETYFTNSSYDILFTGWAYFKMSDKNFYPDNGVTEEICYIKDGRLTAHNVPRNCMEYVMHNALYILPDKTMGGKSALIFNLGSEEPCAFETGVDCPYVLSGRIIEIVSRRLKYAAEKGITAYKMK